MTKHAHLLDKIRSLLTWYGYPPPEPTFRTELSALIEGKSLGSVGSLGSSDPMDPMNPTDPKNFLLVPGPQTLDYTSALEQSTCLRCGERIAWEPERKAIPPTCWAWCCGYTYTLVGKTALVTVEETPITEEDEEDEENP